MADLLPPLKPIPIKERLSILYIEHGHLDVLDGAFVVVDYGGEVILGQYSVEGERKRLLFLNADYAPLVLVPPYQIKGVVTQRAGRRRSERKHYSP